jgi:hypothetical protein
VAEIFKESSAYYLLGVERAMSQRPGDRRSIEVKVRRKGARVYSPRSYIFPATTIDAQSPTARASSDDALTRLLPSAARPLALALSVFAGPDTTKGVLRANVDVAAFARADGTAAPLEIVTVAVDRMGRVIASARQTSTVSVTGRSARPERGGSAEEINVQSHLELAPGAYEIRVAVTDAAEGKAASVFSETVIPRFDRAPLSLSGITVDISGPPSGEPLATTRRTFHRTDRVRALVQIYQGTQRTESIAPVSMHVQILDASGVAVRAESLPFSEKMFENRRADCVITLPLSALRPGDYLLKLQASLSGQVIGRTLRFAVQ